MVEAYDQAKAVVAAAECHLTAAAEAKAIAGGWTQGSVAPHVCEWPCKFSVCVTAFKQSWKASSSDSA